MDCLYRICRVIFQSLITVLFLLSYAVFVTGFSLTFAKFPPQYTSDGIFPILAVILNLFAIGGYIFIVIKNSHSKGWNIGVVIMQLCALLVTGAAAGLANHDISRCTSAPDQHLTTSSVACRGPVLAMAGSFFCSAMLIFQILNLLSALGSAENSYRPLNTASAVTPLRDLADPVCHSADTEAQSTQPHALYHYK